MIRCPSCADTYAATHASCPCCGCSPLLVEGLPSWAPALAHGGGGFEPQYFEVLAKLEARHFWFRARNRLVLWAIGRHFPGFRSFIEIGCGTGYVLAAIAERHPQARLVGSEVFTSGLLFARGRVPRAQLMQMDARDIPFEDEFDLVGAFDVLEHIAEDDRVLGQVHKALLPGGGLLLTVPQHPALWSAADTYACHVRRYTARALHEKIRAAGFEILRSTSFVTLLLPALLLSRFRSGRSGDFDPMDEFRIGDTLNGVLERVLGFERRLVQVGMNFPVGGSRLVVARKRLHRG